MSAPVFVRVGASTPLGLTCGVTVRAMAAGMARNIQALFDPERLGAADPVDADHLERETQRVQGALPVLKVRNGDR